MAPVGIAAALKRALEGRSGCPRKSGARVHPTNGTTREATQELGGRKTPGMTGRVYSKARSETVAPMMRGALGRVCPILGVGEFVRDLEHGVSFNDEGVVGLARKPYLRAVFLGFVHSRGARYLGSSRPSVRKS